MKLFCQQLLTLFRKGMIEERFFSISFYTEKVEGHGEDAPPLLINNEKLHIVGVFDGMGGAGAATCESSFGEGYTKAYVASRIIRDTLETFFVSKTGQKIVVDELKNAIIERLKIEQENYPPKTKSLLRSKLVRDYPTTMAVISLQGDENQWIIDSYWAGDSHNYLWTKDGFFQISKDDLEEANDPMENLHNDSPISNCICSDRNFQINHKMISIKKQPVIILSASDGCFGYYSTPMHFENMLKECLKKSKDEKDWQEKVIQRIQVVTGDDTSMSLIAFGFDSFNKLKSISEVPTKGLREILKHEKKIKNLEKDLANKKELFNNSIKSGWESYKEGYMKYLNE